MLVADWVPVPIVLPKQIRKLQTLLGSVVVQAEDGNAQFPGDGFQFPVIQVEFRQHQQRGAVTLRPFGELAQREGGELQLLLRQQIRMPCGGGGGGGDWLSARRARYAGRWRRCSAQ